MAGVALGDIDLHFAWQAWHFATATCILRGRCGTYGTGPPLVARLVPSGRRCRRGCLRGRCGTWRHRPPLCVAGVALGDIDAHSAWHAWHLRHWLWWRACFPVDAVVAAAVCVAGVALGDINRHFAWQAWHLVTSTLKYDFVTHNFVTHNLSHLSLSHT